MEHWGRECVCEGTVPIMTPTIRLTALKRPSSRLSCIFFGVFGGTVSVGVMSSVMFVTSDML
jgi:hypothetical protein